MVIEKRRGNGRRKRKIELTVSHVRVAHGTPVKDTGWMPRTHAQFSAVVQKN